MPTSFDALHEETRHLAMLYPEQRRRRRPHVVPLMSALALLAVILFVAI